MERLSQLRRESNLQDRTKIQDVASLCSFLFETGEPCFLSLKGKMLSMNSTSPQVLEAWKSTQSWPKRQEVNQQAVDSGLYYLAPLDGPAAACCISGAGHTLTDVHICLADDKEKQAIIIADSCSDIKIQDSVFEGTLHLYWLSKKWKRTTQMAN